MKNDSSIARRTFLTATAAASLTASMADTSRAAINQDANSKPFSLKFAPHPGMFKASAGKDVIDQINFCHEKGFTAFEYNGIKKETPSKQQQLSLIHI